MNQHVFLGTAGPRLHGETGLVPGWGGLSFRAPLTQTRGTLGDLGRKQNRVWSGGSFLTCLSPKWPTNRYNVLQEIECRSTSRERDLTDWFGSLRMECPTWLITQAEFNHINVLSRTHQIVSIVTHSKNGLADERERERERKKADVVYY